MDINAEKHVSSFRQRLFTVRDADYLLTTLKLFLQENTKRNKMNMDLSQDALQENIRESILNIFS